MNKDKQTKFEKLKSFLLSRKGPAFRFMEIGIKLGGRYPSSYHTYLNALHRQGYVKKASRGLYIVADRSALAKVSLGDLVARDKVRILTRKLKESKKGAQENARDYFGLRNRLSERLGVGVNDLDKVIDSLDPRYVGKLESKPEIETKKVTLFLPVYSSGHPDAPTDFGSTVYRTEAELWEKDSLAVSALELSGSPKFTEPSSRPLETKSEVTPPPFYFYLKERFGYFKAPRMGVTEDVKEAFVYTDEILNAPDNILLKLAVSRGELTKVTAEPLPKPSAITSDRFLLKDTDGDYFLAPGDGVTKNPDKAFVYTQGAVDNSPNSSARYGLEKGSLTKVPTDRAAG